VGSGFCASHVSTIFLMATLGTSTVLLSTWPASSSSSSSSRYVGAQQHLHGYHAQCYGHGYTLVSNWPSPSDVEHFAALNAGPYGIDTGTQHSTCCMSCAPLPVYIASSGHLGMSNTQADMRMQAYCAPVRGSRLVPVMLSHPCCTCTPQRYQPRASERAHHGP
jgi:hypothetical protein